MDNAPIRSEEEYDLALAEVAPLLDNIFKVGAVIPDGFHTLVERIAAYEATHHPYEVQDPIDIILAHMEENGLNQNDFASIIGSASRASEFLNRKRLLSIGAIRQIHKAWRLPAEMLIEEYNVAQD